LLALGDLMTRRNEEFDGPHDRLAWAIILTFTILFGTIVYFACRRLHKRSASPAGNPPDENKSELQQPALEPWQADLSGELRSESPTQEGLECMECGATIPENFTQCPACGWSWAGQ